MTTTRAAIEQALAAGPTDKGAVMADVSVEARERMRTENIRDDGTVDGWRIETHYTPCKGIADANGYLRVLVDEEGYDTETRILHETLNGIGWVKSAALSANNQERAEAGSVSLPTSEMLAAGMDSTLGEIITTNELAGAWKLMAAAAPNPPGTRIDVESVSDESGTEHRVFAVIDGIRLSSDWTSDNNRAERCADNLRALLAATSTTPVDEVKKEHPRFYVNGFQLRDALEFIAPDGTDEQLETEAVIQWGPQRVHDEGTDPEGYYCWFADYPEEGSIPLDSEARPVTTPQPPTAEGQTNEPTDDEIFAIAKQTSGALELHQELIDFARAILRRKA